MTNRKLGGVLLVAALVVIVGFGVFKLTSNTANAPAVEQSDSSTDTNTTDTSKASGSQNKSATLTMVEVQKHNSESSCWTIINGSVYDITEYISRHPGGDEILRACGADGTSLFVSRTTEDGETVGSGTPHSSSAENQLQSLLLGKLKD